MFPCFLFRMVHSATEKAKHKQKKKNGQFFFVLLMLCYATPSGVLLHLARCLCGACLNLCIFEIWQSASVCTVDVLCCYACAYATATHASNAATADSNFCDSNANTKR